jgi:hypothetical protein
VRQIVHLLFQLWYIVSPSGWLLFPFWFALCRDNAVGPRVMFRRFFRRFCLVCNVVNVHCLRLRRWSFNLWLSSHIIIRKMLGLECHSWSNSRHRDNQVTGRQRSLCTACICLHLQASHCQSPCKRGQYSDRQKSHSDWKNKGRISAYFRWQVKL